MAETAIFLAEGFEEIEALTVVDLLRRASIPCTMVSIDDSETVKGSHGIEVRADARFSDVDFDRLNMIILPGGGLGTQNLKKCEPLKEEIRDFDAARKPLAAICAAPTVFGEMGLLKGRKACCYPACESGLEGAEVTRQEVTVDGNYITSRGMGTAIPFGLAIIEYYQGNQAAAEMADKIVYQH